MPTNQQRNFGRRKRIYRRKRRSSYKKKYLYRRKNSRPTFSKMPIVLPDEIRVKLRYNERISMTSTAGAISTYLFSGNSMYDPNVSGTGSQPLGFDQWTTFYDQYTVTGSKITVRFTNVASTNGGACNECAIMASQAQAPASTMADAISNPYCKSAVYTLQSGFPVLSMYMSTAKMFGENPGSVLSEGSYSGLMGNVGTGSSPTALWEWQLYAQPIDQSTTTTSYVYVTIVYYARLNLRKLLALS